MSRIWRIEINLDETAALLAGLETVEDRGRFLDGFMVGARGFEAISEWPQAKLCGYHVGRKGFEIATIYSDKQSDKGRKSAEAKRLRKFNHGSTTVNGWLDHGLTTDEPSINQASTNRSNDLTNTKEQSPSAPASATPPVATRKKRGEAKREKLAGINQDIVDMVARLMKIWPTTRENGSNVVSDDGEACVNVERIMASFDGFTLADLEESARAWVATGKGWPNGIQYYFGPGKKGGPIPPWKAEMKIYLTNKELAHES